MEMILMFAGLNAGNLVYGLVFFVIIVIVFGFLYWVTRNYVPAELQKWAILVLALVGVLLLVYFLFSLMGGGFSLR